MTTQKIILNSEGCDRFYVNFGQAACTSFEDKCFVITSANEPVSGCREANYPWGVGGFLLDYLLHIKCVSAYIHAHWFQGVNERVCAKGLIARNTDTLAVGTYLLEKNPRTLE